MMEKRGPQDFPVPDGRGTMVDVLLALEQELIKRVPKRILIGQFLMASHTEVHAIQIIITSILGIFGVAASLNGFVFTKVAWPIRILFALGGLTLLVPTTLTDIIGLAVVLGLLLLQYVLSRRKTGSTPAAA